MKITGLILAIIGLIGGLVCVVQIVQPFAPQQDRPPVVNDPGTVPNLAIPLAVSAAAVVVGLLMMMYGGRGYIVSNNPKVRN